MKTAREWFNSIDDFDVSHAAFEASGGYDLDKEYPSMAKAILWSTTWGSVPERMGDLLHGFHHGLVQGGN